MDIQSKQLRSAEQEPKRLRVVSRSSLKAGAVVDDGGKFGAGLIKGYSVITRGEALGHNLWIDSDFLDQVVEHGNARERGLKVRFTHPSLSGDGLGKQIGKAFTFRRHYNQVLADLHLLKSSHTTPNGDLGKHVLDLAHEAPEDFGTSIVFASDEIEMRKHKDANTDGKTGIFASPDAKNKSGLPHARLANLTADDVVDEPAANPAGMFSAPVGSELAASAESYLAFALGLSEKEPQALGGFHPKRARAFVASFIERHGITISFQQNQIVRDSIASRQSIYEGRVSKC